jgi:hypothetical protein
MQPQRSIRNGTIQQLRFTYHPAHFHSFSKASTAHCWALVPFVFSWSYTQSVGLLGRGISLYLHTGKQRINAHTDIHASSGIRTQDPNVEDSAAPFQLFIFKDTGKYLGNFKAHLVLLLLLLLSFY